MTMSDNNFVFVVIGLRYTSCFLMMWNYLLKSTALYGGLMEAVAEVGIVVGTCAQMVSSMGAVVGYALYSVFQASVCVG